MNLEKEFINYFKKLTKKKFTKNTNLIKQEFIDSYGIIELIDYIENTLNMKCPISRISTSNFNSITTIIKYLKKYNKNI